MTLLVSFIVLLARVFNIAILIRIILSWMPMNTDSSLLITIRELAYAVTEPILAPIRRVVPTVSGLDLSPMIAIILVQLLVSIFARLA
ncbi:MAG: YggT family protein [Chloroflexi bacterium]|jgi:YggT family protein|nr:YggT family protein [Chloroflexota bacterium]